MMPCLSEFAEAGPRPKRKVRTGAHTKSQTTTGGKGTGSTSTSGRQSSAGESNADATHDIELPHHREFDVPHAMDGLDYANPSGAGTARNVATPNGLFAVGGAQNGAFRGGGDESFAATVVEVNVRLLLEGAFSGMTSGTIMMPMLSANGLIPTTDPYLGSVSVTTVPANVIDWIQVDFRMSPAGPAVHSAVGFLREDGQIANPDGLTKLTVDPMLLPPGAYYVVVRHRNQLAIMTSAPIPLFMHSSPLHDFTPAQSQAYMQFQMPMNEVIPGTFHGTVAGDAWPDGDVDAIDRIEICNSLGMMGYLPGDVNLDGIVNASDLVLAQINTFRVTQVP